MEEFKDNNYTLEKHLKYLSDNDKEYELLYSIWDLNKKNLTQGLNVVSINYPNFSLHDVSHSYSILDNIQSFLGTERIKCLGATDTFLLLMASLTHDIGMILTYKMIEKEWAKSDFEKMLEHISNSEDVVVSDAAKSIMQFHKEKLDDCTGYDSFKWALEIKNAVVIITAELFRNKHAKLSAEYLKTNTDFKKLAENYHADQLPNRFVDLLANVAYLHGQSFDEVISQLYFKADGFKRDYIHPRFIACMVRLGDLLDFDSNRFNLYANASLKEMPEISKVHQLKHASVKHKLVSPSAIEAELDCPDERVYRVSRSWFDWLEKEVNNQSREWTNIAPEEIGGLPPVISKDSIKILYNGIQAKPELLNLRFTMSQKKMFEIIQGGGIYKEPGFAFIREIVQNAFDASKLQMWTDICSGFYDSYFVEQSKRIEDVIFPDDIMPMIYNQYPVKLSIKWKDKEKNVLCFECEDRGTGISEATLLRMTQHVGESHSKDPDYNSVYQSMPYWLKPTAAFGIGLQSVFFVAPTFEVETSYPGEKSKRIIFRSAAENQYSSIVEENIERKRGTTVKVEVPKERFSELFGTTFSWDVLGKVDVFKGEGDDVYLAKIDEFVLNTFRGIEYYVFQYEPENPERKFSLINKTNDCATAYLSGDYKVACGFQDDYLLFKISEKKYGSAFTIWFDKELRNYHLPQRLFLRDVLVSNAKFNYFLTAHSGFEWNLHNQTTDRIVDLSRDNLTYNGRRWISDTLLNILFPDFIRIIGNIFKEMYEKRGNKKQDLDAQYLNYCLTAMACRIDSCESSVLEKIKLPSNIISYNNKEINAKKFFENSSLYLVGGFKTNGYNTIIPEEQKRIEDDFGNLLKNKVVLWGDDYLGVALMFNYMCTEIIEYNNRCSIYKLDKFDSDGDSKSYIPNIVTCSKETDYLLKLEQLDYFHGSRSAIFGLKQYSTIVVKRNYISGFEHFPNYSNCYIYSPFSQKGQVDDLLNSTINMKDDEIRNYIRSKLSEYITPYMMLVVKRDNINNDVTEDQIKEGYISLISDFITLKRHI